MAADNKIISKKRRVRPLMDLESIINEIVDLHLNDYFTMEAEDGETTTVHMNDLKRVASLGEGRYGYVDKMVHCPSGRTMAVKVIRQVTSDERQNRLLNDLHISQRGAACPQIVTSYGAMQNGGDIWICMEALDLNLDRFYHQLPEGVFLCEELLVYVIFSMVSALSFLHGLKIMHRDVKPCNVLLDRRGRVQICDFGISGFLQNSHARTNVGSEAYLAPERVDPGEDDKGYTVRADVWALGVTVVEVACRRHPLKEVGTRAEKLRAVVGGLLSPDLPDEAPYSPALRRLVEACLKMHPLDRPAYPDLLAHALLAPLLAEDALPPLRTRLGLIVDQVLSRPA